MGNILRIVRVRRAVVVLGMLAVLASVAHSQVRWLEDASSATIGSTPVSGQVKGKSFTAKFGNIRKTGGISFGEDSAFDHYTITLQDAETGFDSAFGIDMILTVRKGDQPYGRTFRRIRSASLADQPGPGDKTKGILALAEFYSLTISYRSAPQGPIAWVSSGADRNFTGRLELTKRTGDTTVARLYVCFDDPDKSCAAGSVELSVR
jgi:hypothetical protein